MKRNAKIYSIFLIIVKYLNWFIDNKLNELFIAVEWAEKGDLKLVIKKAMEEDINFQEKRIVEYISQIAGALQHMHEKRIMHRDLKLSGSYAS